MKSRTLYEETFYSNIYFIFYDKSTKYWKSRENRGMMVMIPSGLEIFRSQNSKDSKNDMKL